MARNENVTTSFKVDISDLKKSMQEAKRQVALANSEFKAVSSSMDDWSKSSDGLKAKLTQLNSNLSSQKAVLAQYEKTLEQVKREYGENSKEAQDWQIKLNNQQAVVNKTESQIRKYESSLDTVADAERRAAENGTDVAEELNNIEREAREAGDSAESASGGFTVMKGALASLVADGIRAAISALKDFSKAAVSTGMDFESSMAEVGAISGATGKDMELLEETAKKYGATTVFSASESAQALKYMALAGWDAEKSASALGGILDLAAASGMDLAQASDMVTDYMSAFGMEADKSKYFADMLAFAQSNANTSAEQLGEAYKNCAANLNAAGQDVETTTALLSMMANQGFKGSEAGTALTAIMRDMTAKMKDGKIAIGETSVTVMDANGNYRDMTEILKDVEAATNGMGDAERATALQTTFTADSTKGLNLLLNAGVGEAEKFEEALRGAGGTAGEMGETMNDTLAGDVKEAQSALEDLMITAYDELQPHLREIIQYVTDTIIPKAKEFISVLKDEIIPAIKEIPEKLQEYAPLITGIASALAGLGLAVLVGNLSAVIAAIKTAITTTKLWTTAQAIFNAVMNANPIVLIVSLLAALVVAFVTAYKTNDEFKARVDAAFKQIGEVISNVVGAIVKFFTETVPQAIQNMIDWFSQLPTNIANFVEDIKAKFVEWRKHMIETIVNFFNELPTKIGYALGFALGTLVKWGLDALNWVKVNVPLIIESIITFFKELPSKIWTWLVNTIAKITQWGADMKAKATETATSFVNNVITFIKELPSKIQTWLTNTLTKLSKWKSDMGAKGKDAINELINKVIEGAKTIPEKMMTIGKNIVDGVWQGIQNAKDQFFANVKGFFSGLVDGAKEALDINSPSKVFAKEIGKWIPEGIAVGIDANASSALKSIKALSADMVGSARFGLSSATGAAGSYGNVVYNFNQTNNSPRALSRLEIYRQSKNLLGYAGGV